MCTKRSLLALGFSSSILLLSSCATTADMIFDSMVDDMFDSALESTFKTKAEKEMESDTKRMQEGKPLKYYPSERRLRLAREKKMIDDMMAD